MRASPPLACWHPYRFEVTEEVVASGSALTLHVTDLATGRRRFVATLHYAARADLSWLGTFVEDFWSDATTCLAQEVRSAAIRRAMALIDGSWRPLTRGYLHRHPHDAATPGHLPVTTLRSAVTHGAWQSPWADAPRATPNASQELEIRPAGVTTPHFFRVAREQRQHAALDRLFSSLTRVRRNVTAPFLMVRRRGFRSRSDIRVCPTPAATDSSHAHELGHSKTGRANRTVEDDGN